MPKRRSKPKGVGRPAKAAREEAKLLEPVFVSIADLPKNLDTLPQVPWNVLCSHLAEAGDYLGLSNLRKANRSCKERMDVYLSERSSIPSLHSVTFSGFRPDRDSFNVKIRLHRDALPLHDLLSDLRKRIIKREKEDELICLTIAIRHKMDPAVEAIKAALPPRMDLIKVDKATCVDDIQIIHRMLENSCIKKMNIKFLPIRFLAEKICSEIVSMIEQCSVKNIELESMNAREPPRSFIEHLARVTKEGSITAGLHEGVNTPQLNSITNSVKMFHSHARVYKSTVDYEESYLHNGVFKTRIVFYNCKVLEWKD